MTIVTIFLYYAFCDIAYTPLLIAYGVEILPFRIRAEGFASMGSCSLVMHSHGAPNRFFLQSFVISGALVFNQYVNPVALKILGWKYYLFHVGWLAFEAQACFREMSNDVC